MKNLLKRFKINISSADAEKIFINKICNIVDHSTQFKGKENELYWPLCNKLGLRYDPKRYDFNSYFYRIFNENISFAEFLTRLQCFLDLLNNGKDKDLYCFLIDSINDAIQTSPIDLQIILKFLKEKGAQIYPSGSPLLDEKLVNDVLGFLEDNNMKAIKTAFEKGLKEFLESKKDLSKLKNVIRDMQLSSDELVKYYFKDKNLGLKHLFKENRYNKLGLNEYQKQIFWNYNEMSDKLVKHSATATLTIADVENHIYLTGLLIRLGIQKI